MSGRYFVYILVSKSGNALYTGMTGDLRQRLEQLQLGNTGAHTLKYRTRHLVWFEVHDDMKQALLREKRIKRWRRAWKVELVNSFNPTWRDLSTQIPL